jgi:hypothetical protein
MRACVVLWVGALLGGVAVARAVQFAQAVEFAQAVAPSELRLVENLKARSPLERALETSRTNGKPVLVIVTAMEAQACRGRWLADWLEVGGERLLAHLSLVEVAFATREQLRACLPRERQASAERGEVGLLDALGAECDWTPIESPTGTWRPSEFRDGDAYADHTQRFAAKLVELLESLGDTAGERALLARRGLTAEQVADLELALSYSRRAELEVQDRCAWVFRYKAQARGVAGFGSWEADMKFPTYERLVRSAPHGARWVSFEDERFSIEFLPADDELERQQLAARAPNVRSRALIYVGQKPVGDGCASAPCGSGHFTRRSYEFLAEYTRALISATNLD